MDEARTTWRPKPLLANSLLAVLCLIWGSTWLVIKTGLRDLPPFWSAGVRFCIAAIAMALVAAAVAGREGGDRPRPWLVAVVATLGFSVTYALVYWSETVLPSGVVSVLWAVFPIMQAISGHFFLPGERLAARQWAGFAIGFSGVGVLFLADLRDLGLDAIPVAAVLLLSPLCAAVSNTLVKRHGGDTSSLLLNRNAMAVAAGILLAFSFVMEPGEHGTWTATAVFSVAYLSIVGTVVTFGLYYWLLRYSPAHRMSLIAYITPPVALLLGWTLADEPLTLTLVGGTALILLGVGLTGRGRSH